VTGAGGMMGSHMVEFFKRKNFDVLGTYYRPTTDINEIKDVCTLKELDVRDYWDVHKVVRDFKPDRIFHLAAQSYPTVSWDQPQYTIDTNTKGTTNLFEAVKNLKLDPMIMNACSSAQYGFVEEKDVPVKESHPMKPLHPYGVTKVTQEMLAYQYFKNFGIRCVNIRIFNTTGPRKVNDVCADFTKRAVEIEKGKDVPMRVGNLQTRRAITDVRDAINAFWLATEKGQPGETYNFSGDQAYLIGDLLQKVVDITGITPKIWQDPALMRPTDEPIIFGDATKLKEHTGWSQQYAIDTTLKDMVAYWRNKN